MLSSFSSGSRYTALTSIFSDGLLKAIPLCGLPDVKEEKPGNHGRTVACQTSRMVLPWEPFLLDIQNSCSQETWPRWIQVWKERKGSSNGDFWTPAYLDSGQKKRPESNVEWRTGWLDFQNVCPWYLKCIASGGGGPPFLGVDSIQPVIHLSKPDP